MSTESIDNYTIEDIDPSASFDSDDEDDVVLSSDNGQSQDTSDQPPPVKDLKLEELINRFNKQGKRVGKDDLAKNISDYIANRKPDVRPPKEKLAEKLKEMKKGRTHQLKRK